MKKYSQLPLFSAGVAAAALLFASTAGFAAGNYKGEMYKGEPAAPCPVEKMLKDGFYVGAQIGYDSYRANGNYNLSNPAATITANGSNSLNATGWAGGLFAGYGQYFQDMYYLAGEVLVNTSGASQNNNGTVTVVGQGTGTIDNKFSANTSWGLRLLPGIKLNNSTLLYIPLGWMSASLKGTTNLAATPASTGVTTNTGTSKSQYQGAFVYGVGMETVVYENFSIRGEYNHTNYNSFSTGGVKWSPYDNQVMLGLLYHFA